MTPLNSHIASNGHHERDVPNVLSQIKDRGGFRRGPAMTRLKSLGQPGSGRNYVSNSPSCHAARTLLRNLPISSFRRLLSLARDCAADRTCEEAEPVSFEPRCTSAMLDVTCRVPVDAC